MVGVQKKELKHYCKGILALRKEDLSLKLKSGF